MPVPITPEARTTYNALSLAILLLPGFDWCNLWSSGPQPAPSVDDYVRLLELSEKSAALARSALGSDASGAGAEALAAMAPKPAELAAADAGSESRLELSRIVAEYEPAEPERRRLRRNKP
ncbi:MAG: hypothetical protein AMXMBFR59_12780 [Rhodanobacteraceae bacterium]